MTDAELIDRYTASQDEAAFAEIVSRHSGMVYRVCCRILGDPHESEDASQAVFIVLMRKAGSLRRKQDLSAWLYGVAVHVALQALRKRTRRSRMEEEYTMLRETGRKGKTETDAERILVHLDRELRKLSAVQRQAVILRYLEGKSQKEAAGIAGCPQGTLGRRASDGLASLRKRLARSGFAFGTVPLRSLLESEAEAEIPETLASSVLYASKRAAGSIEADGAVMELAEGVMKMMIWQKVKLAAVYVSAALVVTFTAVLPVVLKANEKGADTVIQGKGSEAHRQGKPETRTALFCIETLDGIFGFIDKKGNIVVKPEFGGAGPFSEGLAAVNVGGKSNIWGTVGGKWGYIDISGRMTVQPQFDSAHPFSEGLARVSIEKKGMYIDRKGSIQIVLADHTHYYWDFSEGLARFRVIPGGFGYMDKKGATVIKPGFQGAKDFKEGLAAVKVDEKWGYIDENGTFVIKPRFSFAYSFSGEVAVVHARIPSGRGYINGPAQLMDKKGKIITDPGRFDFEYIGKFSEGLAPVRVRTGKKKTKYGYINKKGRIVIPPRFDNADEFSEGLAAVRVGKRGYGYIDINGTFTIEPQFGRAYPFSAGLAKVGLKGRRSLSRTLDAVKEAYINTAGKMVYRQEVRVLNPMVN